MTVLENAIGTAEAAEILGLSPHYVKRLCQSGKIPAKIIGRTWIIDRTMLPNDRIVLPYDLETISEHPAVAPMISRYVSKHRSEMLESFAYTFNRHMAACPANQMIAYYGLNNLKLVEWIGEANHFHVEYKNASFRYTLDGEWY